MMSVEPSNASTKAPQADNHKGKEPVPQVVKDGEELGEEPKGKDIAEEWDELEKEKSDFREEQIYLEEKKFKHQQNEEKLSKEKDSVAKEKDAVANEKIAASKLLEEAAQDRKIAAQKKAQANSILAQAKTKQRKEMLDAFSKKVASLNPTGWANKITVAIKKAGEDDMVLEYQYVQFGVFILALFFLTIDSKDLVWLFGFLCTATIIILFPKLDNFIGKYI